MTSYMAARSRQRIMTPHCSNAIRFAAAVASSIVLILPLGKFHLAFLLILVSGRQFDKHALGLRAYGMSLARSLGYSTASLMLDRPSIFWTYRSTPKPNPP